MQVAKGAEVFERSGQTMGDLCKIRTSRSSNFQVFKFPEHSEISRSREISRDLDSFFRARPRDFERKYLALVSNSEMFRQKSRSRLEL